MKKTKLIYRELKNYKLYYILAGALLTCDGVVTYYYPSLLERIIDVFLPLREWNSILIQIFLLGLCQLTSIAVGFFLSILFYKLTNEFVYKIKNMIIEAIFCLNGEEVSGKSEKFLTCMGMDMNNVQLLTSKMMADFMLEIITLFIIIVIVAKINRWILLLIIILYPTLLIIQKSFNRIIQQKSKEVLLLIDYENSYTKEFSLFMERYILLNAKQYYLEKFNTNEKKVLSGMFDLNMNMELNSIVPRIISTLAYVAVLGVSSYMVVKNYMTIGEFTILLLYTPKIFVPLSSIMTVIGQLQKTHISVERISDLL